MSSSGLSDIGGFVVVDKRHACTIHCYRPFWKTLTAHSAGSTTLVVSRLPWHSAAHILQH